MNYLVRVGDFNQAQLRAEEYLEICSWMPDKLSQCYRILGDLAFGMKQFDQVDDWYNSAIKQARLTSIREVLIEALLARGRWAAKFHGGGLPVANPGQSIELPLQQAFSDLREALGYATDGGYRLYEADIRIALAWAHLASGNPTDAKQEATRAQTMSTDMGYHWGQVDAAELLDHL